MMPATSAPRYREGVGVALHAWPRQEFTRAQMYSDFGRGTIMVDGCCPEGPFIDPEHARASLDHHRGVIRGITQATCCQAYFGLPGGLFDAFRTDGVLDLTLHVNDCDPDVYSTVYVFTRHPHIYNRHVARLIHVTGEIDVCGGWHPSIPLDSKILRELAWISQPYVAARLNGELARMDAAGMLRIIELCCNRIDENVAGRGREVPLNMGYDVLDIAKAGFYLVRETGFYARMLMRARGIEHFVSVREGPNGTFLYSNGFLQLAPSRTTPSIERQLAALLSAERVAGGTGSWGGSDIISGGPRAGSVLTPAVVCEVIAEVYGEHRARIGA